MTAKHAKFRVGQLIAHRLFEYRGVIVDVDPVFQGSDEWYDSVARTRPPKEQPWYHVLVHDAEHMTYVAERNLGPDDAGGPVRHPAIGEFFRGFEDGGYRPRQAAN